MVSLIVLPLLPDRGYGPWGALNPREIWLVVVLVSALSFAGFLAVKLFGAGRGMALTGALGGLVSSTAVTVAMAAQSRAGAEAAGPVVATALASTVMCARVAVLVGVVNPRLLPGLLAVVGSMALTGGVAAWWFGRSGRRRASESAQRFVNPFSLSAALGFGALYALVVLAVRGADVLLGARGVYTAAALAGTVDVDAPTVAFARGEERAVAGITIAVVSNTLVKSGLAYGYAGAGSFRRRAGLLLAAMAAGRVLVMLMVVRLG